MIYYDYIQYIGLILFLWQSPIGRTIIGTVVEYFFKVIVYTVLYILSLSNYISHGPCNDGSYNVTLHSYPCPGVNEDNIAACIIIRSNPTYVNMTFNTNKITRIFKCIDYICSDSNIIIESTFPRNHTITIVLNGDTVVNRLSLIG